MFRVAVVGCGGIGRAHANAWKSIGAEVVCVCDLLEEKAAAMAAAVGCGYVTDAAKLPTDLDAVSVTTPPQAHYAVAKQLLTAGYNVFCEKPLTLEETQGEELCALAKEKGCVLSVGFKMRYEPIFIEAKKHIGEIGRLQAISSTKQQAYSPRPEAAWITRTGAMYELSVHDFDLISFITGRRPQGVIASKVSHRLGWEKEDAYALLADYGDGVTATLEGMYALKGIFCYRDLTLTFLGDEGYMRVERPDRIILHTSEFRVIDVESNGVNAFAQELTHFAAAVRGEEPNPIPGEDAVVMTRFINEAYRKGC